MIDQQIRNNDCGISAVKTVYNILRKDISRKYIKENIFINQQGSRMSDLKDFIDDNDCETKYSLLDVNTTKGKKQYFEDLFPFIVPVKRKKTFNYVVVNGIKGNKLKVYDSTKLKPYYSTLEDLKQAAHLTDGYLEEVDLQERLESLVNEELLPYNITAKSALKDNAAPTLFNKLSYFSYYKENYPFKTEALEKKFLLDVIHNLEIPMLPVQFQSLNYTDGKIKVNAPVILTVKAKDKKPVVHKDYPLEEESMYIKLLKGLKSSKKLWYIYIFTALFAATVTQLAVFINQILIDVVLPSFQLNILIIFAIGVAVFKIFNLVISQYKSFIRIHLGNILDKYFLNTFDQKLNDFSIRFIQTFKRGDLTERLSDSRKLKKFFLRFFTKILVDVFIAFYSLFILFFINWKLTFIVLIVMILFYVWYRIMTPILKSNEMKRFAIKANYFSTMIEKIEGIQVIKSFKIESLFSKKVSNNIDELIKIQTKVKYYSMFNSVVVSIITLIASLVILTLLSKDAIEYQTITLGQILTFLALTSKIFGSLSSILKENLTLQENLVILKRYFDFNESNIEVVENENKVAESTIDTIEFSGVNFEYLPGAPVLKDLNISIKRGDKIRIGGKNGSGKSTFCKTLALLYEPSSGKIEINDLDSKMFDKDKLREQVLLVSNEDILFNESLLYNVTFGKSIETKRVIEVAKQIDFYDFISTLPAGLNHNISENGKNLSTGQRKKVLLMRTLLSGANIIILDEVLSGIDTESRLIIEKTLSESDLTLLIISHEAVENITFNKTYYLKKGELKLK